MSEEDYYQKAKELIVKEQYEDALLLLDDAIKVYPNHSRFFRGKSVCYSHLSQFQDALHYFQKYLEKQGKITKEDYYQRSSLYNELGYIDNVIEDLVKYIEEDQSSPNVYCHLGDAFAKKGMYEKALEYYNTAIRLDENCFVAYNGRGIVYNNQENYKEAIKNLDICISLSPLYYQAYANRGLSKMKLDKYSLALLDYNESLRINSNNPIAYYGRGRVLQIKGEIKRALVDCENALELKPDFADCWMLKATCSNEIGDIENAKTYFYRAFYLKSGLYENALILYNKRQIAPFFAMRIISNEILPSLYNTYANLIIDTFATCSPIYAFILWKALKRDTVINSDEWQIWLSCINFYMGDCLASFEILSQRISSGNDDLMSFFYLLCSCSEFEENDSIYLNQALKIINQIKIPTQPEAISQNEIIKYYYAGHILVYDKQDDKAKEFFELISHSFLPAAYMHLYILEHDEATTESEKNVVINFIAKKEKLHGENRGYVRGLKKHELDLEKDTLRDPFLRHFHYGEIRDAISIFVKLYGENEELKTQNLAEQEAFYNLFSIRKEDLNKARIKTYIAPLLEEWEQNLKNVQAGSADLDMSEEEIRLSREKKKLRNIFRSISDVIKINDQENEMALSLQDYELSLNDYTELLNYFFLKGHFTPYQKMTLHFYILYQEISRRSTVDAHKAGIKDLIKEIISTGILVLTKVMIGSVFPILTIANSVIEEILGKGGASYSKGYLSEKFMARLFSEKKKVLSYRDFKSEFEVFVGEERERLKGKFNETYMIEELK